jgi:hypothetical protein
MAAVVLGVLGLAHLALHLLLTASARAELTRLEARYDAAELAGSSAPGPRPDGGGAALSAWHRAEDRFEAAEAFARHGRHVRIVGTGLLASFLLQAVVTVWLLSRSRPGVRRAT